MCINLVSYAKSLTQMGCFFFCEIKNAPKKHFRGRLTSACEAFSVPISVFLVISLLSFVANEALSKNRHFLYCILLFFFPCILSAVNK